MGQTPPSSSTLLPTTGTGTTTNRVTQNIELQTKHQIPNVGGVAGATLIASTINSMSSGGGTSSNVTQSATNPQQLQPVSNYLNNVSLYNANPNLGYANTPTSDPFRLVIKQFADMLRPSSLSVSPVVSTQEGFTSVALKLDEIAKIHEDIVTNYKKYLSLLEFSGEQEKGNVLFGSSSANFGDEDGFSNEAFENIVNGIKNHVTWAKESIESLIAASENFERKSLKGYHARSLSSSMSGVAPSSNTTVTIDWSTIANKKKYFEIRDEIEILLTFHLEEIRGYRDIVEKLKKSEAKGEIVEVSVISILMPDEFGAGFWKNKCGENVFSMKKNDFLDIIDLFFQQLKDRVKKIWVEDFSHIIDPTCDNVVSIVDFKHVLQWFGPFGTSFFVPLDNFLNMKHFWGSISAMEAQMILDSAEPGSFLIRFSGTDAGSFAITVVEQESSDNLSVGDEVTHYKQTLHFQLTRKREDSKMYFTLCESDMDQKFETVDALIKHYRLTFKYPFVNDQLKLKAIEPEEETDFLGFIKSTPQLNRIDAEDDTSFIEYRGRIPQSLKEAHELQRAKIIGGNNKKGSSSSGNVTPKLPHLQKVLFTGLTSNQASSTISTPRSSASSSSGGATGGSNTPTLVGGGNGTTTGSDKGGLTLSSITQVSTSTPGKLATSPQDSNPTDPTQSTQNTAVNVNEIILEEK
ncbi:hypothetical protein C9374_009398 [Naegleria lovaniensis]|uniref:SH2 domain-containing protein n=1 Tax=Naegleria lovaniensis TaxID=51637 RepID=A0AA88KEG5_NAELO|nr:uncharacterized protein C9374_009398 [Naegleria lovaniensis]KAG2377487.1 hypothetical protein C9374_009398 [Naegleria lovaniensis]